MDEITTKDPTEAVELLLGKALDAVPYLSEEKILSEYSSLKRAWGSRQLFLGDSKEVKAIILPNLKELAQIEQFEEFFIRVSDVHAQANAIFSTGTFTGVRVWHTDTYIYTCGNSAFGIHWPPDS